jgi:RecA/RadA recombinase
MLVEIEAGMQLGVLSKCFCVIDSVAALLPEGEALAGIVDANMKSDMDLAKLMGRVLRRWVGTAQVYNVLIALVSQLREGPSKGFGDSAKTSGGNAPKFYSHIRVRARRVKGGRLMDKGRQAGIMGILRATKNKSGGIEGSEMGYRIWFKGPLEFIPAKIAKAAETESR